MNFSRFVTENYLNKKPFSNFLPGIAGFRGIPIWCYTVNRGQGIASFGVEDKDHAIMEFHPAHQSYRQAALTGFRTFLRIEDSVYEPFQESGVPHRMLTGICDLALEEENDLQGFTTHVLYYTLPGERVGALVRELTIKNITQQPISMEILDGIPEWIPYGISYMTMKVEGQTAKAWMQVEDVAGGLPWARIRASMEDTATVQEITGGNFAFAMDSAGNRLPAIVDTGLIFGIDNSLRVPYGFLYEGARKILKQPQRVQNQLPSCFFSNSVTLLPGESTTLYAVFGQADRKALAVLLCEKASPSYFAKKHREGEELVQELCAGIRTRTANHLFDAYCEQTMLDNILRGGYPVQLAENCVVHLYGRKHGDLERDYNFFRLLPEYYSQGNANYRDVAQNRRSDVLFYPEAGRNNIQTFYNLIQLDGYNPLVLEKTVFKIDPTKKETIFEKISDKNRTQCDSLLEGSFTPGEFVMSAEEWTLKDGITPDELLHLAVSSSTPVTTATFGEGYWIDHWTYTLDLVDSYLSVFPDQEEDLLFGKREYLYYETRVLVNPRRRRFVLTPNGLRQYEALDLHKKPESHYDWAREDYGKGAEARSTLIEKMLLLCTLKFSTLDPYGMGVEMETGKPGWYDALNGLPGMMGSSMCETCELARLLRFVTASLQKSEKDVQFYSEISGLIRELNRIVGTHLNSLLNDTDVTAFWQDANECRESYRAQTMTGVSGKRETISRSELIPILDSWIAVVDAGIAKAGRFHGGAFPTYFTYQATNYQEEENGYLPVSFEMQPMPLFLEGFVHRLKLPATQKEKAELTRKVLESGLYDKKLRMFKVNEPLNNCSHGIGRAYVFTPGWLENESIWLHMEYKYLLGLLMSGLYEQFSERFLHAAVPFFDPAVYGRSTLENVSFIASSANPDPGVHGQGFVARLSGATAEFLQIWQLMMVGEHPFTMQDGTLTFQLRPCIPQYLMPKDGAINAVLLGKIALQYETALPELIPGQYRVRRYRLLEENAEFIVESSQISGEPAHSIRNGFINRIVINID